VGGPSADFEYLVRDALIHLYDVVYLQTHPLAALAAARSSDGGASRGRALRQSLLDAIEALRPVSGAELPSARERAHRLLELRYVEALEIAAVQGKLAVGRSMYFHEHARALAAVVSLLRERWDSPTGDEAPAMRPEHRSDDGAARPTSPARRAALPAPLTSFVGREREIAAVQALLGGTRLVTLTGTGGVGKSRLALRVVAELVDAYADGVWFVDLAPLADEALVPHAVLAAFDLDNQSAGAPLAVLTDYLRHRRGLVVLDNCEHVVAAAARLVDELLRRCQGLRVLATSRELLGVAGEAAWRVPSLGLPEQGEAAGRPGPTVEALGQYEAVRLFVDRARLVAAGFELTDRNAAAVAELCARLDGIPLAIELAAARVRVLPVEQIAARLDDWVPSGRADGRFGLLTGGSRTAPPRHQTLRAAIDWSFALLSEGERTLLRRLSVFAGGWTLDAAEEVCAGEGVDPGALLDLVTALADKSLLFAEGEGAGQRCGLLETIRQYAAEKLHEAGEVTSTRDRHLRWCLGLVERAAPELTGPRQLTWLDRLEVEHDNLRVALGWATASGEREVGLRIGAALGLFWWIHDRPGEGRRHLEALLERSADAGAAPSPARAEALAWTANMALWDTEVGSVWSGALAEQALALGRALGAPRAVVQALTVLAFVAVGRGDGAAARRLHEEAVAVARSARDEWATAQALVWSGMATHFDGATAAAEPLLAEGLALAREAGDRYTIAWALELLGVVAYFLGESRRAGELLAESLATWETLGSRWGVARNLRNLGRVALTEGDLAQADRLFRRSLSLVLEFSRLLTVPLLLDGFAGLAAARGQAAPAMRLAGAAEAGRAAAGHSLWVGEQPELDRWLAPARAALSPDEAAAAWAEGRATELEQAVARVLSEA
jgi:predicted ATPase